MSYLFVVLLSVVPVGTSIKTFTGPRWCAPAQGESAHPRQCGPGHSVRDNGFVTAPASFYDDIGGHPVFAGIVERFYAVVADDPVLRPLYPEQDLGPAEV